MPDKDSLTRHRLSYSSQNKVMDVPTIVYSSGALVCLLLLSGVFIYSWRAHPIKKKKDKKEGPLLQEASMNKSERAPAPISAAAAGSPPNKSAASSKTEKTPVSEKKQVFSKKENEVSSKNEASSKMKKSGKVERSTGKTEETSGKTTTTTVKEASDKSMK